MFEPNSRYFTIETTNIRDKHGRTVAYKRRRFLPRLDEFQIAAEVTIAENERLDLISARDIGDAEQFWRIADANNLPNPLDVENRVGDKIKIPVPGV